jgi:hypothetical protein
MPKMNQLRSSAYGKCDLEAFGSYLHMRQDMYSHGGLPVPEMFGGLVTGFCHEVTFREIPYLHPRSYRQTLNVTSDEINQFLEACACKLCET